MSIAGQMVLITASSSVSGAAEIHTDKDDYAPGETVIITGTGFKPAEHVTITLQEDPQLHPQVVLTSTADSDGNFTNTQFSPDEHDLGIRFVATAVGDSGSTAQATFTDSNIQNNVNVSPASVTVNAGNSAIYTITVNFGGNSTSCTAPLSVTGLPTGTGGTIFAPTSVTGAGGDTRTSTLTIPTTLSGPSATPPSTYNFTVTVAASGDGCDGANRTANGTLIVTTAANTAPVLAAIGDKTVNELATLSFTATATDAQSPPQTLTYSLDAGAPAGAAITAAGAFTWTPTEAQGPGSFSITIRVTDNGSPVLDDFETITVTVNEENAAPVL
jgi:hypothetical protein